jgi:hypothetical protein
MPRLAFKPDASFFRKIAIGAVGTRAIRADLAQHGHSFVELERGSTDTKLWKEVKRKRVRIPDLVCIRCGQRIESRAKTKPEISMSHSDEDTRAWDYGLVGEDLIAFPICDLVGEEYWSAGRLDADVSYWHERNWARWQARSHINYFKVVSFRDTLHDASNTKGVTEGSETAISWGATFATFTGVVEGIEGDKVTIRRGLNGRRQTWTNNKIRMIHVATGDTVHHSQIIMSNVEPLKLDRFRCAGVLPENHVARLLASRERTQRFTGVKLARLRQEAVHQQLIGDMTNDAEEDIYIRLEGAAYIASVCAGDAASLFGPHLESADEQTQLEAVITLGEADTEEAIMLLCDILNDTAKPYFLRSAAAWSLGRTRTDTGIGSLIEAFADIDRAIREEALAGIVSIGGAAVPVLLASLSAADNDVAAGAAEA